MLPLQQKATVAKKKNRMGIFDFFVIAVLVLLTFAIAYPIYYTIIASFSDHQAVATGQVNLVPVGFQLTAYQAVFENDQIWQGYLNTIIYTVGGTAFNLFLTIPAAYAMSKKQMLGHGALTWYFLITMYFSGGMVPSFLLIRSLGLMNTRWSVVLSCLMSTYYAVLVTNFIRSLPVSLLESARLDGASETTILLRIVLPLSKPIIATIALFYTVDKWNEWWNSMLYINRTEMYPLQLILQNIINTYQSAEQRNIASADALTHLKTFSMGIKMAAIVVTMLPIMCVFPFLQRFFVKGIMIGAVKG